MRFRSVPVCIRIVLLAACTVAFIPAGAAAQQVGGGVKLGVTFGDVPNAAQALESSASTSERIGLSGGAFVMIRFANGVAIQPEVLYTQKGVKLTESMSSEHVTLKTDFLEIPILFRYTFGKGVRGYVFAGPSFDFKMSAKITGRLLTNEVDISSQVKSFEFAAVFGGGIELGPILLEGRWSEGFTNLENEPTTGAPEIKTRTLYILGGLRF